MNRRNQEGQFDNWITEVRRRLATRREEKPETKGGQIWALWPEIKERSRTVKPLRAFDCGWKRKGASSSLPAAFGPMFADVAEKKAGGEKQARPLPPRSSLVNRIRLRFRFSPRCRRSLCRCETTQNHRHKHL